MNRNKLIKKTGLAVMTAAMAVSASMPAMAAGTNYSGTIEGTKTTTFDKYLVMDAQAEVPNVSFSYSVAAGDAKAYDVDGKKFEVLAGVDADKVTMAGVGTGAADNEIVYKQGDATAQDDNAYVKDYDKTTEKYAKKTATLDFSQCNFTEPGVYRYILTETDSVQQGITNDSDLTRIVDVYVEDASTGAEKKLTIAGYVLHSNADDSPELEMGNDAGTAGSYADMKSQGFTNSYDTSDLTIRKEVTGNQASRDKYFKFTVAIANAVEGTVYQVDITGADATSGSNAATIDANEGQTNPTSLTVGADGTVTQDFYLQHGQEITIQGIAKNSTYTVTEDKEDYKSTANTAADSVVTIKTDTDSADTNGTIVSTDLTTGYLNTRDGVIPTGIIMTVAPFAIVTLLGGAGLVTIMMKKKKDDDEE